jgi:hypothetical protein
VAKADLARAMFWHDRAKKKLKILNFKDELPSLLEYTYLINDDVIIQEGTFGVLNVSINDR